MQTERTIVDALLTHAAAQPERTAFTFNDGETVTSLTYRELLSRANSIAAELPSIGTEPVLLLFPPGLDFIAAFAGCMLSGHIAVPAMDSQRLSASAARLLSILADTEAGLGLTHSSALESLEQLGRQHPALSRVRWIAVDRLPERVVPREAVRLTEESIAFVQYTSGSIRTPRGVVITHANLVCNLLQIAESTNQSSTSIFAGWLPAYHDMGLVGLILLPLYLGAECHLMSPLSFLRHPLRWVEALSTHGATASAIPAFALETTVQRIAPRDRARLDLSRLKVLVVGAEPVPADAVEAFIEHFAPCGLGRHVVTPCYGLAEATLFVSGKATPGPPRLLSIDRDAFSHGEVVPVQLDGAGSRRITSCGPPAPGLEVEIVDPSTRKPCAPRRVGEIHLRGDNVMKGYWGRRPLRDYLRTGDLGFMHDGELYVAGRADDVLLVRGRNIHPADVEWTAKHSHAATVRHPCAVFLALDGGVVAAQEVNRNSAYAAIAAAIRGKVAREHELELDRVLLLPPNSIPRTSSGKVRRPACREALASNQWVPLFDDTAAAQDEAAGNDARLRVFELVARAARIPLAMVIPEATLIEQGCDSIAVVGFHADLERDFESLPPLSTIVKGTVNDIVSRVGARRSEIDTTSDAVAGGSEWPLGPGQLQLWFEFERSGGSAAHHIARALRIRGRVDNAAMGTAFGRLIDRHDALRSVVELRADGPWMRRRDDIEPPFRVVRSSEPRLETALNESFRRPFDLTRELPIRAELHRRASESVLLVTMHHIAADFASAEVVAREWMELYEEIVSGVRRLSHSAPESYGRFARWHAHFLESSAGQSEAAHWRDRLRGVTASPGWQLARPRVPAEGRTTRAVRALDPELTRRLGELARREGVTRFTLLLAVFHVLVNRYTQERDVAIAVPASIRTAAFLDTVGYFVNTLLIRCSGAGNRHFRELLDEVRAAVDGALANARWPLSRLERSSEARETLWRTMFVDHGPARDPAIPFVIEGSPLAERWGAFDVETIVLDRPPQYDVFLAVASSGATTYCSVECDGARFDVGAAERLLGHYETLLWSVVEDPTLRIDELAILTASELAQFDAWNATAVRYDAPHVLHELIAGQVRRTPDAVAVQSVARRLTFAELDAESDHVAQALVAAGAGAGSIVAALFDPGVDMVVALVGILKAGAAYAPIDPDGGRGRTNAIIEHLAPAAVVTTTALRDRLSYPKTLCVNALPEVAAVALPPVSPDARAYVIYTSGSTGRPKGVMVSHRAICNRLLWMRDRFPLAEADCVLAKTPYVFDVSVWEIFLPLITGARMVLPRPDGHRDPAYLVELIRAERVSIVHFVPSMLAIFLAEEGVAECGSLRFVIASGEALPVPTRDAFFATLRAELHNLYGPTEAAVDVTAWDCASDRDRDPVPIGYPISNVRLYVMGGNAGRMPVGVAGELCIAGVALADGYWREPDLTAEQFVRKNIAGRPVRMYRTGDLVRYRDDGSIDFIGRVDDQVKVSGMRVEPAEVEAVLRRHPSVVDCAVVPFSIWGQTRLAAYVIPTDPGVSGHALRADLEEHLPPAFVPASIELMEKWPLMPTGKLDRKRLPAVDEWTTHREGSTEAWNDVETALAEEWSSALGVSVVRRDDNFFRSGGDSLRALQLRARMRDRGYQFALDDLFQTPTLAALAKRITRVTTAASSGYAKFSLISDETRLQLGPDVVDAFPLSRLQEALLFHSSMGEGYETYVLSIRARFDFNEAALRASLEWASARHDMLRMSYALVPGADYIQCIHDSAPIPVEMNDISMLDAALQDERIREYVNAERYEPFEWTQAPLLRVRIDRRADRVAQVTVSHPLFDGWSLATFLTEWLEHYADRIGGREPRSLSRPRTSYGELVALERAAIASPESRGFWSEVTSGIAPSALPRRGTTDGVARRKRQTLAIGAAMARELRALAQLWELPLKSALLAVHARVVATLLGRQQVMTGLITNGRIDERDGDVVVGLFLNTVPLRVDCGGLTWSQLAHAVFDREKQVWPHRRFPFVEIAALAGGSPVDTAFNYIHFYMYERLSAAREVEVLDWINPSDLTYFPLCAYFNDDPVSGALLGYLDYDLRYFTEAAASDAAKLYEAALRQFIEDPHGQALEIQAVSAKAAPSVPRRELVHRQILRQAAQTPDAPAVRQGARVFTYGELAANAQRLASHLRARGVGRDVPVGIALDRTPETVIAVLGVLAAGGCFVPISPDAPAARVEAIVADCGLQLVIDEVLLTDIAETEAAPFDDGIDEDALAYVMYTSGSTGEPKGVEIPHRALANTFAAMAAEIGIDASDRWLSVTSLSFDISILELLLPLTAGGTVSIAARDDVYDGMRLASLIDESGATIVQATPSMWRLIVETGWNGHRRLRILCGGEALSRDLANRLLAAAPVVWNVYGPTEATIWCTIGRVEPGNGDPSIGRPLANVSAHVLSADHSPVPNGAPGELWIGGAALARGYRNRDELTRERFIADPFGTNGARLYGTGDRAVLHADGTLQYLGRMDAQVKVRGFRVEPGAIEAVLRMRPDVGEVVVAPMSNGGDDVRLTAFIRAAGDIAPAHDELASFLGRHLPPHMIPTQFIDVVAFPINRNGKVDRDALVRARPAPAIARAEPVPENVAEVMAIFADVLQLHAVAPDDSFFLLGGHSLLAMRACARAEQKFARPVPVHLLFEYPTARRFAERIFAPDEERVHASPRSAAAIHDLAERRRRAWEKGTS